MAVTVGVNVGSSAGVLLGGTLVGVMVSGGGTISVVATGGIVTLGELVAVAVGEKKL